MSSSSATVRSTTSPAKNSANCPKAAQPNKTEGSNPQTISNIPPKVESTPSMPKIPSINLSFGQKKEEPVAAKSQEPTANSQPENRPFTADQLRDAWVGLIATHKGELRLKELMESYIPRLIDEHTAEIQMPNPWQMDQMRKAMPELARQLREALHNSNLHVQLVQAEYSQEQMSFTAEEKYDVMAEQNPALAQLKEKLDLQID